MFDFEKLNASKLYAAPHVERVVEFSPPGIDVSNIAKVLSLSVEAKCASAEPFEGYAEIAGRTNFRLTYVDKEGEPKGADLGADFNAKIDGDFLPSDSVSAEIRVVETDVEATSSLKLSAWLDVAAFAVRREELSALTNADNCYKTMKEARLPAYIASKTTFSPFDAELSAGGEVSSVLSMNTDCVLKSADATDGGVRLTAEVISTVVYVEGGEIKQRDFKIDLEEELNLDGVEKSDSVLASACVKNAKLVLQGVTDDNELRVEGEVCFKIQVFRCSSFEIVAELFNLDNEMTVATSSASFTCFDSCGYFTEKAGGSATLADNRPAGIAICAIPCARAMASKAGREEDGTLSVEGVVNADIIYTDENGFNSVRAEIPFALSIASEKQFSEQLKVDVQVLKISATLAREREIDIDMTLAVSVAAFSPVQFDYISSVEIGEEKPKNTSGISLYIARGGDELLDLCKALSAMPEDIMAQNPSLEFPLAEGERAVYFRRLSLKDA